MPPDEFGAWGQWAGATFAAIAVVVALWVAISDTRRRDRERQDQRAAQARTILSRVDVITTTSTKLAMTFSRQVVMVENHGTLPITDVVIHSVAATHKGKRLRKWIFLKSGDVLYQDQLDYRLATVIGPGAFEESPRVAFAELMEQIDDEDSPALFSPFEMHSAEVTFSFLDAEGVRWRRVANGPPVRVLADTPA